MDVDWHAQYFHVTFTFPSMCVPLLTFPFDPLKAGWLLRYSASSSSLVGLLLLFERASL